MSRSFPITPIAAALALVLASAIPPFGGPLRAAEAWTDYNGDGLPDPQTSFTISPGRSVSVDLWVDSEGFPWTHFLMFVEWDPSAMSYQSAEYLVAGGTAFPVDRLSHPSAVGLGGFGYNSSSGPSRLARVELRYEGAQRTCVSPMTDVNSPDELYSQIGAGADYALFADRPGQSCFESGEGRETTSWGGVKASFR